jgi:hypothetical protein
VTRSAPPIAALLALLFAVPSAAQPTTRTATTLEALGQFPIFFHGRTVVVRGTVQRPTADVVSFRTGEGSRPVFLLSRGQSLPDEGVAEVRGEFWDLGRLTPDDPHLTGIDIERLLQQVNDGRWPAQNQVLILITQAVSEPQRLPPGLRAIALEPDRYEGQTVTVIGRFRGANLYGDVPQSPGKSRWDFVIQAADAALWVTGQRPRGKGFNFDSSTRLDTGRSLEVTGVVRRDRGLVWIEATKLEISSEAAPAAIVDVPVRTTGPPPQVAFTLPVDGETDVTSAIKVRIQFTRDMAGDTFRDRVRVTYVNANATTRPPPATIDYRRDNRVLEMAFSPPLERFSTVKVELLPGITSFDGVPLGPWSMEFSVGAR